MLPTFVIGLREGLEAALIVGIVAAFLRQRGGGKEVRWVWVGVLCAVALCAGAAVALNALNQELPQRQQEALEGIISLVAVVMVTSMILWMSSHAHELKGKLESSAGAALATGSVAALVGMAFLAVLREGLETAVFLLAAFQVSTNRAASAGGAVLGIAVSIVIGWAIYRGGVRINLARFFTATGLVLVLVAAGLMSFAVHAFHEAGWINVGQSELVNLSWFISPGSVSAALFTGVLGIQPRPTVAEGLVWILYLVPVTYLVIRSARRGGSGKRTSEQKAPAERETVKKGTTAVAAVAVGAMAIAGCGSSASNSTSGDNGDTAAAKGNTIEITLSDDGCEPRSISTEAGGKTFKVTNSGGSAVTEFEVLSGSRIIGEVENVIPGGEKSFSLDLKAGKYTTKCPGGAKFSTGTLTVTPGADANTASAAERTKAVDAYLDTVKAQADLLKTRTAAFVSAIKAGDVDQAKTLYASTRAPYEQIEPIAESFGDLDPEIDAREGDVPVDQWGGFHRLEKALWTGEPIAPMAPVADKLQQDVDTLRTKLDTVELEPSQIANGSVELLDEVSTSKITGEEDRYSHTDLSDFESNLAGSKAAYESLKPLLSKKQAALVAELDERFAAVEAALAQHAGNDPTGNGFVIYTTLTPEDTRALSTSVDALAEPMSQVSAAVLK